jgi:hypothetical protein
MTTPDERTQAVLLTREFLNRLAYSRAAGVPESIRHEAKALLRHYPDPGDMEVVHGTCPGWLINPEESESESRRQNASRENPGLEWLVAHSKPILIGIGIAFAIT